MRSRNYSIQMTIYNQKEARNFWKTFKKCIQITWIRLSTLGTLWIKMHKLFQIIQLILTWPMLVSFQKLMKMNLLVSTRKIQEIVILQKIVKKMTRLGKEGMGRIPRNLGQNLVIQINQNNQCLLEWSFRAQRMIQFQKNNLKMIKNHIKI